MMNRNPARPVVLLFKPPQQGKLLVMIRVIRRGDAVLPDVLRLQPQPAAVLVLCNRRTQPSRKRRAEQCFGLPIALMRDAADAAWWRRGGGGSAA